MMRLTTRSAVVGTVLRTVIAGAAVVGIGTSIAAQASTFPVLGGSGYQASPGMMARSQGYLGVDIRDIGDDQIAALKLKESRGAEVTRVDHDGPAGKAGLREHDVILQVNGQVIEGEEQLRRLLRETPAGRTVTILLSRDGQQQNVTIQLANRQEVERQAWEQRWHVPDPSEGMGGGTGSDANVPVGASGSVGSGSAGSSGTKGQSFFSPGGVARGGHNLMGALSIGSSYTGAVVETMGPQLAEFFGTSGGGVLVHRVDANSPAANAGLRAGDVVVRLNSVTLTNSGDWMRVVRENRGKAMPVVVLRDKKEQTLTLTPDGKKRSSVDSEQEEGKHDVAVASWFGYSFR